MPSLLVLLLSPLLCQGASVYQQDQWTVVPSGEARSSLPVVHSGEANTVSQPVVNTVSQPSCPGGGSSDASCSLLRSTMELLKAASTTVQCPACDCDKADAEETCVAYVASVLRLCRTTGSGPDHQVACVKQELSSGYPAGMAPCSSDAAVCTAIASFAKTTAATFALTCTDVEASTGDRHGRIMGLGHIASLITAISLALASVNTLDTLATNNLESAISCTAISPPAAKLPCIFPFHQGENGEQESVAGVQSAKVYNGCATDDIWAGTVAAGTSAPAVDIVGQPAGVATLGLNDAPRWCATAVNAAESTGPAPRGSSIRGNAVAADRMIRWRYCGLCVVV